MILTAAAPQLDAENPWPGLASFEESAHAFFFGRTDDTRTMLAHVLDTPVTVLNGSSGLGKTSLLRAGLFPELRDRNFLPIYVRLELKHGVGGLSQQLHQAVRNAIRDEAPDAMLPSDAESLWEYLHRKGLEIWSEKNQLLTPVLVIDQFEEVFTLGERVPELVDDFQEELGDLAENRIPAGLAARIHQDETVADQFDLRARNFKLLISLREDYLAALDEWCGLIPALSRSRVRLHRLPANQALEAVHEPAAHLITSELASRVVSIVAGKDLHPGRKPDGAENDSPHGDLDRSGVEPALLSLFCRELNEMRKRRGLERFDEDLVEEAQEHTLANYYLSCVGGMELRVARFIETELITETGFRDRYIREDAVPKYLTDEELEQLIQSRLLRLDEDRYGAQWIELTHDVLTDVVREHREVARTAELEAEKKRQQAALDKARKRARILVALLAVSVVAVVVAAGLGILAFIAQRRAQEGAKALTAQKLVAEAQGILNRDEAGTDVQAFHEILAARALSPKDVGPVYTAAAQRASTIKIISGHVGAVASVAFSPDGDRIASAGEDGTIRLWNAYSGEQIGLFTGHTKMVQTVAFSPDGVRLASGGDDGTVRLWNVADGRQLRVFRGQSATVYGIAFSPDGHRLASAGFDKVVRLWNADTGDLIGVPLAGHTDYVVAVAFSRDGKHLATGSADKTVRLWDLNGGPVRVLQGHTDWVLGVSFSWDGQRLASTSTDGTVRLWDVATGSQVGAPLTGHTAAVSSAEFSPDGHRLASSSWDHTVRLWDVATARQVGAPLTGHTDQVTLVAFSPDGRKLASSSADGTVRLWAAASGAPAVGGVGGETRLEFSPDGRRIASVGGAGAVRLWDPSTGKTIGDVGRSGRRVTDIAFSPDGKFLASADYADDNGTVQLWDANTGQQVGEPLAQHNDVVFDLEFSRDGTRLATAGIDGTVRLWDPATGKPVGQPLDHEDPVFGVVFSPDSHLLATDSGDHVVRLWNPEADQPIGPRLDLTGTVYRIAFSPHGNRLATVSDDGKVRLWDTGSGHLVGVPGDAKAKNPTDLEFTPNGELLVASGGDNIVRTWNVQTGEPVDRLFKGHTGTVTDLEFSPDGEYLATASADDTVRLWDTDSGDEVGAPLKGNSGSVAKIAFSPDGDMLASEHGDGAVQLWPVEATPDMLCAKLTRNMTRGEWSEWVSKDIDYDHYQPLCKDLPVPK